ncbi:hypothetical protein C8R45DRAFT_232881 [Mycena sanguinolenta]|nr:hypothetical protein C8R45DRAFT_232881 [Mycena sanguinolenta]
MADSIPASEIAALIAGVKQIFATSFIGFSLATTIYGISILQVYLYYRNYPADRFSLKFMVALLFLLDTLCTIFVAHSLYTFYVLNFDQNPLIDLIIPWSFSVCKHARKDGRCTDFNWTDGEAARDAHHLYCVNFLCACHMERFSAHCNQRFNADQFSVTVNKFVAGFIIFLAVTCLALGLVTTVELFTIFNVIGTRKFSIISGLVQGLAALNDVIISIAMIYYLHHNRSGLPSTTLFVDKLILYAVSRGTLTAVCQILFLVTNVALPGSTFWQPWHQMVGKFLNVRGSFTKSEVQLGTTPEFKKTRDGTPGDVELSMDSSNQPKPITFTPIKATDSSALTSSAFTSSALTGGGGGGEK